MWEGGVRVPAIASWPGHIQAGTTTSAVFATMDIFATALDAAGVTYTGAVEAKSFLPVLLGKATSAPPRDVFFVRRDYPGGVHYGARSGDYKLVQMPQTVPSCSTTFETILRRPPTFRRRSPRSCSN